MHIDSDFITTALRQNNRLAYLACLLMQDEYRLPIATLYAFDAEIDRIRQAIKEPLPGEIRLQWWREVTAENARKEEASANPLSKALNYVIDNYELDRAGFDGYCRARIFDLYDDPMPDKETFEGYSGETASFIFHMSCNIISEDEARGLADVSGHGGVAYSVASQLIKMSQHASRGQVFLPGDILQSVDLDRNAFLEVQNSTKCREAIRAFAEYGRGHLLAARESAADMSENVFQAYLPLSLCDRIFNNAEKLGERCLREKSSPSIWKSQWDLWRASRKGMF